jgi:hypothetical protein
MKLRGLGISSAVAVSTIILIVENILGIKKTIAICVSPLFILLLALQLNSVGFTPAFAQLGGPDGSNNNLNLTGIWERIDDNPIEDLVYINQQGSNITATFEPIGACYEDPYNPIEGTEFSRQKLEFRGNLIGNTIQGEVLRCMVDKRTTELWDLNLRVSPDGRTLDGYFISPDGQQNTTRQYVFASDLPPISIEINTDRPVYDLNEPVEISGQVTNMLNQESEVFIEVYGPDGQQVFSEPVLMNSNGSFSTSFDLNGHQINNGTYTAVASHVGANDEITFSVQQHDAPIALPAQNPEAQIPPPAVPTHSTESKPTLQVQCIQTPVFPQGNQRIIITAKVVDEWAAPKVADSIEIEISATNTNRTEPFIMSENVNSSSSFNYTIGPFTNLTEISYGCRGIDNSTSASVFSGMKNMVIGDFNEVIRSFNESRAVPVPYTGDSGSNLDILFIADNKTFSSPTDPDFLIDVETAIRVYYNQSVLLKNQNKTNFWIAQDMGQAENNCQHIPPANWGSEYVSFEAAIILHRHDSIRDCTKPGIEISTANMATLAKEGHVVLHEIGHRPFGLADEYDGAGFFISSYPYPNVFNSKQECDNYIQDRQLSDLQGLEKTCRQIRYQDGREYFTADTKPNDLMVDHKQFQDLDNRRIEKWFENCLAPPDTKPPPPTTHCKAEME